MKNSKVFEEFSRDWMILDRDSEFFLISELESFNRRVISVCDNEEGSIFVEAYQVPSLVDQDEDVIDYMLEYSFDKSEIEDKKEIIRADREELSDNNFPMFSELQSHKYGEYIGSEVLDLDLDDVALWYNSKRIVNAIKLLTI